MKALEMLSNKILRPVLTSNLASTRAYTCIVERHKPPRLARSDVDQRKIPLKSENFQMKLVDCLHTKKWGNIDLILTQYVEGCQKNPLTFLRPQIFESKMNWISGVGHKGEIVNVTRHEAYYHLLPARLAVYPTEEYLKMFEKDRQLVSTKAKVSPYAQRAKTELHNLILEIPMNFSVEWSLNPDFIRIALRYNVSEALFFGSFI